MENRLYSYKDVAKLVKSKSRRNNKVSSYFNIQEQEKITKAYLERIAQSFMEFPCKASLDVFSFSTTKEFNYNNHLKGLKYYLRKKFNKLF